MKKINANKILILEKYEPYRAALREVLSLEGYEVLEATNGFEGVNLAKAQSPDIVLSASTFSDYSCWEVYQKLNKEQTMKNIPFICLSSRPLIDEEKELPRNVRVLRKPLSNGVLINAIQNYIYPFI